MRSVGKFELRGRGFGGVTLGDEVFGQAALEFPEPAAGGALNVLLEEALQLARDAAPPVQSDEIFVIGGGEIYALALPYADRLDLTLVDDDTEGDAYFPEYEREFTKEISREEHETPEGLKYAWVNFERT